MKLMLLSKGTTNAKTAKKAIGHNIESYILYLAPASLSGTNLCPKASEGCKATCLFSAGRGAFKNVHEARMRKTRWYLENRISFFTQLDQELSFLSRKALKNPSVTIAVRLNGTSDIAWESHRFLDGKNLMERHPNIQFYDYTKIINRLRVMKLRPIANYHLTFSRSETNEKDVQTAISLGFNVAQVYNIQPGYHVNGDAHDFRFLDPKGSIIALTAKGKARKDASGFVIQLKKERAVA